MPAAVPLPFDAVTAFAFSVGHHLAGGDVRLRLLVGRAVVRAADQRDRQEQGEQEMFHGKLRRFQHLLFSSNHVNRQPAKQVMGEAIDHHEQQRKAAAHQGEAENLGGEGHRLRRRVDQVLLQSRRSRPGDCTRSDARA